VSDINYISINENFPVPGQDNDTQVFRDNFDTIKNSLRLAKEEITDLQDNVARKDEDNDYGLYKTSKTIFQECRNEKWDYGATSGQVGIDFEKGHYQIIKIENSTANFSFENFPGDPLIPTVSSLKGVGSIILEITADNVERIITFTQPSGTVVKRNGFPGPVFSVTSQDDPVFIEVWRHRSEVIYIKYLGQFT